MDETVIHEIHVELTVVARGMRADQVLDADAAAYLWVCACGDGDDELAEADAYAEARRHARVAG